MKLALDIAVRYKRLHHCIIEVEMKFLFLAALTLSTISTAQAAGLTSCVPLEGQSTPVLRLDIYPAEQGFLNSLLMRKKSRKVVARTCKANDFAFVGADTLEDERGFLHLRDAGGGDSSGILNRYTMNGFEFAMLSLLQPESELPLTPAGIVFRCEQVATFNVEPSCN